MSKPGRNDPCPCGSGKKYKHCCLLNPAPSDVRDEVERAATPAWDANPWTPGPIPADDDPNWDDGRDDLIGEITPLEAAYDLSVLGWAEEGQHRIAVAKEALALSPDCAEAYLLWASAVGRTEALALYDEALTAVARDLGDDWETRHPTRQWDDPAALDAGFEARRDRGRALIALGRSDEGIELLRQSLVSDPVDYGGARYDLLQELMRRSHYWKARDLITGHADALGAVGLYMRALIGFRERGDTFWPRRALVTALAYDPGTAMLLVGEDSDELDPVEVVALGATLVGTATYLAPIWEATPGAMEWLTLIFAAGPDANLDALPRGDGPILSLAMSDNEGYLKCPRCRRKTKHHHGPIAMLTEPDYVDAVEMTYRTCDECTIVLVFARHLLDAGEAHASQHGLVPFAHDVVLLGMIDPAYWAEASEQVMVDRRPMTDFIQGWSDEIRPRSESNALIPVEREVVGGFGGDFAQSVTSKSGRKKRKR